MERETVVITPSRRFVGSAREWLAAAAIGALGTPLFLWFLVYVWAPVDRATPGMLSLHVVILLSMPVGLLAGTVARGIGGFLAFWFGALAATVAVASQFYSPGLAGLAATMAVVVIPQSVLLGYILARMIDGATSSRSRSVPTRIVRTWLVPSIAAYALVGLIGVMSGVTLRSTRAASCASVVSDMALSGRIAFVGAHALCVADLDGRSVRMTYASSTDVDETLTSPRWSPDGRTIAVIREQRPMREEITAEIILVDAQSGAVSTMDPPGQVGSVRSFDWAPDGRRLVVAAEDEGCSSCARLYIATVAPGPWDPIPSAPGVNDVRYPAWSPVDDQILVGAAFDENEALYGRAELLIINPDGRVLASVATDADYLSPASWSHDASRIAFGRRTVGGVDLYLARGDGTLAARLTSTTDRAVDGASIARPVWSPDGRVLAVSVYASNELPHAISILGRGGGPATLMIPAASDYDWAP